MLKNAEKLVPYVQLSLTLSTIWLFSGCNNVIVAKKVKEGLFYTIFSGHFTKNH